MVEPTDYIAVSFFNIHSVITRALKVSIESAQGFVKQGFQDAHSQEGFFNYIRALISVLNAHHLTEDELAFPYFQDKIPDAPFESLSEWHQVIVHIIDEIKLAVDRYAASDHPEAELKNLENALIRLDHIWHPHIQIETDTFILKADALIPVEERLRLVGLFGEHGVKLAVPHNLTVAFLLYNLPLENRTVFAQGLPAEIIQHLVPVVWKADWESMKPFLLD